MMLNLKKSLKSIGLVGFVGLAWWLITSINTFQDMLRTHDIVIAQHAKEIDRLRDKKC